MPPTSLSTVARQVRKLMAPGDAAAASDAHLLERIRAAGDEAAFAMLVRRHGPLVMGVCRRVLRHHQDAEDAFQATFLVLAKNAPSIRRQTALASWLYGVARRVAADARRAAARRQARERRGTNMGQEQPDLEAAWRELQAVLAQEVERLPQKYQLPFVLCCLEGRSKAEAAAQLGWKEGTVSSRLAEARKRMQQRLVQRGLTLTAALCAAAATADTASALSPALVTTTVRAALGAGVGTAAGVSARAAALANGVTKAMFASKVKAAMALLFALGLLAAAGSQIHWASADPPATPPEAAKPDNAAAAKADQADAPTDPLPAGAVLRLGSTGLRHGKSVSHLVLSPDGAKVAAYGWGQLSVWDTRTGGAVRRVELPKQAAQLQASLVWLADGRGIVMLQGADTRDIARLRGSDGSVWEFTDEKAVPKILPDWGMSMAVAVTQKQPPADKEPDWCYAVSPDGKTLAVGRGRPLSIDVGIFGPIVVGGRVPDDQERPILLRPLKTDAVVSELPGPNELARLPGNCKRLSFTPDGKRLVALGHAKDEHLVVIWDLASGKETARFKAPGLSGPRPMAVSNTAVAIGREDGGTSLWDLATGKERKLDADRVTKASPESTGTLAVAFAPDGQTLATGGRDGLVKLWDVASGRRLRTLEQQYTRVEALAWSRDGRTVASAVGDGSEARDGEIRLWEAATGKEVCPQPGHHGGIIRNVLSPDGKIAVTAAWDRTVRCWDTATGRELRVLPAGIVNDLAVSADSRTVLASDPEGRLRTWDLATGRETTPADLPDGLRFGPLAFTPDGRRLITASGPRVTVLDWPALKVRRSFDLPKPDKQQKDYECLKLAVSPDGAWLVTAAERSGWRAENPPSPAGGVVDLWDLGTGQHIRRLAEWRQLAWYFQPATMAAFTADGRVVLAPGTGTVPAQPGRPEQPSGGAAALLDPLTPRWLQSFPSRWNYYTAAIAVAPDGRTLYVSGDSSEIVAFEVATGKPRRTIYGHAGCVRSLAMARNGRRLLSGSDDAFALLWDTTPAGAAQPRKEPLTEADADSLWTKLAGDDAGAAFAAMADLAAAPDRAVALVRRELKPVRAVPTNDQLDRTFADLDSEDFATRDKASRRLAEFGDLAVPGVRKRLAQAATLEVRRRTQEFLDRFDPPTPSPDRLRQLRAVELLEGIATPAARDMLSELAKGAAEAPLSREATAALERLRRR